MRLLRRHNSRLPAIALRLVVVVCLFLPEVTWSECKCKLSNSCSSCAVATHTSPLKRTPKDYTEPTTSDPKQASSSRTGEPASVDEKPDDNGCCCCSSKPINSGCCCVPSNTETTPESKHDVESSNKPESSTPSENIPTETRSSGQSITSSCCHPTDVSGDSDLTADCRSNCGCTHVEVKIASTPPVVLPTKDSPEHLTHLTIDLPTLVVDISGLFQITFLTALDSSPPSLRPALILPLLCKWQN